MIFLFLCLQRNCSRLRQWSGKHQSWSELYYRLPLQPWSNAFTLCIHFPHFTHLERSDSENRQKIKSSVYGGSGQGVLSHQG